MLLTKEQLIEETLANVNNIKLPCLFQKGFAEFAQQESPNVWNNVFNPLSLVIMGFGRKELMIDSVRETMHNLSIDVLERIHSEVERILLQ